MNTFKINDILSPDSPLRKESNKEESHHPFLFNCRYTIKKLEYWIKNNRDKLGNLRSWKAYVNVVCNVEAISRRVSNVMNCK